MLKKMEVCTCRTLLSNLPQSLLPPTKSKSKPFLSLNYLFISRTIPGRVNLNTFSLRATSSEDKKSTGSTQYVGEDPVVRNGYQPPDKNSIVGSESAKKEESTQDFPAYEQTQAAFHFLDKLDVKLDSEDTPSMLLLGGGSLIAVWIATVVVGVIDSIPLFPKLMEVVGLAYTLWFSTRYLLFKKNREELVVKIEEIKQQVLGSSKSD